MVARAASLAGGGGAAIDLHERGGLHHRRPLPPEPFLGLHRGPARADSARWTGVAESARGSLHGRVAHQLHHRLPPCPRRHHRRQQRVGPWRARHARVQRCPPPARQPRGPKATATEPSTIKPEAPTLSWAGRGGPGRRVWRRICQPGGQRTSRTHSPSASHTDPATFPCTDRPSQSAPAPPPHHEPASACRAGLLHADVLWLRV